MCNSPFTTYLSIMYMLSIKMCWLDYGLTASSLTAA